MYRASLIAAAIASIALPALAATSPLGIDMSKTGSTKAEHVAYFHTMNKADQTRLSGACKADWSKLNKAEQGFCNDIHS
jgi:hypothetical protein